jgi:hypothetical protein
VRFSSTLGMCEMELAAERCVELCVELCLEHGSWGRPIGYDDMRTDSQQNGYLQLVACGLLRRGYLKRYFFVSWRLIEVLREKLSAEELELRYDPTSGYLYFDDVDDPYHLRPRTR